MEFENDGLPNSESPVAANGPFSGDTFRECTYSPVDGRNPALPGM